MDSCYTEIEEIQKIYVGVGKDSKEFIHTINKIKCKCGGKFDKKGKYNHEKTNNHKTYLENPETFTFIIGNDGNAKQKKHWQYDN